MKIRLQNNAETNLNRHDLIDLVKSMEDHSCSKACRYEKAQFMCCKTIFEAFKVSTHHKLLLKSQACWVSYPQRHVDEGRTSATAQSRNQARLFSSFFALLFSLYAWTSAFVNFLAALSAFKLRPSC